MHDDTLPPVDSHTKAGENFTEKPDAPLFRPGKIPDAAALVGPIPVVKVRSLFQRVILPLLLFFAGIAAVTWVVQYMPGWRTASTLPSAPVISFKHKIVFYQARSQTKDDTPELEFQRLPANRLDVISTWDINMADTKFPVYALEFEPDENGYYDYLFINESAETAELGLAYQSCTCTQTQVCVLPAEKAKEHVAKQMKQGTWKKVPLPAEEPACHWKDLTVNQEGVTVPPGDGGVVRVLWQGEKAKKGSLSLSLWTGTREEGKSQSKIARDPPASEYKLHTILEPVAPVRFFPEKLDFGDIPIGGSVVREFWCWSGTRSSFQIGFPENSSNPCLQCKAEALTPAECKKLTRKLMDEKVNGRALAAYKVTVTLAEKKDGHQLDMGLLLRDVPLSASFKGPLEPIPAPKIRAQVPSDIRIAGDDPTVLDLSKFSAEKGIQDRTFILYADAGVALKYIRANPKSVSAKLKEVKTVGDQTVWELTISVSPGSSSGALTNSFIELESTRPGSKLPHKIRIQVKGLGQSF